MPRSLFGRTLLILIVPLLVSQLIIAVVFAQRHIDRVTRQMTEGVAQELRGIARLVVVEPDTESIDKMLERLSEGFSFTLKYEAGASITALRRPSWFRLADRAIYETFTDQVDYPVTIDPTQFRRRVVVSQQLPNGALTAFVPHRRLMASNPHSLYVWMTMTGLVLLGVAGLFLRNQVRPIKQLSLAAEAFGKGQAAPAFRPGGAEEVRRAAAAFQTMRARLERQISQRTLMLSGVSHDLRTPLTRMRLSLEMLDEGPEVEGLKRDVDHMARMVEDFLAFARGEKIEAPQAVDVHELVLAVVDDMRALGHEVQLDGADDVPLLLPMRAHGMRRCIANLVQNGATYGKRVWVKVVVEPRHLAILVDDDGPGIAEAHRAQLMLPFQRGDEARNQDEGEGSGLGLSIARQIANAHGGDLLLEDSPKGGLRAGIHLPR